MIRHELLHTGRRGRQGRAGLPLWDELAMGQELRYLLSDRKRMRRIVPRQHQAWRLATRHERAVHTVGKPGAVQILVERLQHLCSGLWVILQGLGPRFEVGGAARRHSSHTPNGLRDHSTGDALGLGREQTHDEGPTDALTVQVALVDSQMIEQGDVVGSVGVPAVLRRDGSMGLAASVALIHGDHPEVRGELSRGVHGSGGTVPDINDRLQACGECQDGESLAKLFVIDRSVVMGKAGMACPFVMARSHGPRGAPQHQWEARCRTV